ncbi:MAG: Phosphopantetheine adenylyltransferase [Methanomassiliicoccales archaeon PtaU1.Bin124]|nr:MAG: Phosphopantetheine adenylyltransferase [Methanomassiliicoccales archaeon PtaU1.Bin124]
MKMKVGVGGTFNVLHKGHRTLLDRAFESGDEVHIGIMSDEYAEANKSLLVPFERRREMVESYALNKGVEFTIIEIGHPTELAATDPTLEVLIVSPETSTRASKINDQRRLAGLAPLKIITIPYVLAQDFRPISSSRIIRGELDEEGRLLRPLKVCVGTANQVKVEAVKDVLRKIYREVDVDSTEADSGVGLEPFGDDVLKGAIARARASLEGFDLGIGIEAGIQQGDDGLYDVQQCAIIDNMGWITHGHGPGFRYPPSIERELRAGRSVGEVVDEMFRLERNGHKGGAIGLLTDGLLKRKELTEQAVIAAMVPRIRLDLYRV